MPQNDWDRDREQRDRDRDRDRGFQGASERERWYEQPARSGQPFQEAGYNDREYGSESGAGSSGASWNSGREQRGGRSNQYGGGGGMGSYMGGSQGGHTQERGANHNQGYYQGGYTQGSRNNNNEDWGGQNDRGFEPRDSGWGGYASHYNERGGRDFNPNMGRTGNQEQGGYNPQGAWSGGTGSVQSGMGQGSSWPHSGGRGNYGDSQYGNSQYGNSGQSGNSGQHTGRGPKGYKRSDDRIHEDVNERLTQHPEVDASEVEVEVRNGEVTLKGSVEHRHAKRMIEDVVDQISGVKQVHNQIRVEHRQEARDAQGTFASEGSSSSGQKQGEFTGSKK